MLDVGGGRRPVLEPDERPPAAFYMGMDLELAELETAPAGSYNEIVAADVSGPSLAALESRFDLVISRDVLEHVHSVPRALANIYAYLKPGGRAVISLSGRYSAFGLLNMLLPRRVGVPLVARVMRRDPTTVFPVYYDCCYQSALTALLKHWSEVTITTRWAGATYFRFSRPLQALYVFYEEWARASARHNLATHYWLALRK